MAKKKAAKRKIAERIRRSGPNAEEAKRLADIRAQVKREFPPTGRPRLKPVTKGIGARLRQARERQGLTWYAVAKRAGIPNPATVRDLECCRDVKLSSLEAVATALGMQVSLETVEA